jgi:hypothetical protein
MVQLGRKTAHGSTVWHRECIGRILRNEKYAGDALLQKTFISDCISHEQNTNIKILRRKGNKNKVQQSRPTAKALKAVKKY